MSSDRITSAIMILGAVFLFFTGIWAFFDPESFYDEIATFPPYNEHFIHDFGAFQIGFGVTLLLALRVRDAAFVALSGVGTGAALHAVAHIIDYDNGGKSSDPYVLGIIAAVLLAGAALRWNAATST